MSTLGRHKSLLVALAALTVAVAAPALADTTVPPTTVGHGTISGTATCGSSLVINAKGTGSIANSNVNGYVGDVTLKGSGPAPCATTTNVTLSASGLGPTGSRLACPKLTGRFTTDGRTVGIEAVGTCKTNSYTAKVRWRIEAATGFTGHFTVERV